MKERFYGRVEQTAADDAVMRQAEEVAIRGFTVLEGLYDAEALAAWRERIDSAYAEQEREFGRDALAAIQDLDVCRAPLLRDPAFIDLASHPRVMALVGHLLGEWFILNLQNAIINRPDRAHHQSSWHRDLPYQNWVVSTPLAINALFAIDDFSPDTGGTHLVPYSHRAAILPSDAYIDANRLVPTVPAGSAIVFDSMLFHRGGTNRSAGIRRGVNHLYTIPIMKQQYDFPRALGAVADMPPAVARLLGYTSQVPLDDRQWRQARQARLAGAQGGAA